MRKAMLKDVRSKQALILESGIKVFAQKGYSAATIKEVAKLANVATGTVYLYFKNKDDLLIQCMNQLIDSVLEEVIEEISQETDPIEKLYQFIAKHIMHFSRNPLLARFLIVEVRQSEEFYTRYPSYNPLNRYLSHVRLLIQEAAVAKGLRDINHDALSYIIIGAMDQVLTQWLIGNESIDLLRLTEDIRLILRHGITINPTD